MTISPDAIISALVIGLLAAVGAYAATIKWIAAVDKAKVDHEVCARRRAECPCHAELKTHIDNHQLKKGNQQ